MPINQNDKKITASSHPLDPVTPDGVPRDFGALEKPIKGFLHGALWLVFVGLLGVVAVFVFLFFNF